METKKISVSLVVATYNNPEFLNLVLQTVLIQTHMPDEIVIADDGSGESTRRMINLWKAKLPCPLRHIWHEDCGYRRAEILNKAFAACKSDYIINIDGDILMERHFIADHLRFACHGCFCCGSRVKTSRMLMRRMIDSGKPCTTIFQYGLSSRINGIHMPWLTFAFFGRNHFRGCNMAFWRSDLLRINGFDNRFRGWGMEDKDLVQRLRLSGCRLRFVKFAAIAFHLYHPERDASGSQRSINSRLCDRIASTRIYRTPFGMATC